MRKLIDIILYFALVVIIMLATVYITSTPVLCRYEEVC